MNITFADTKKMKCYEDFVKNPDDRTYRRKFCKEFTNSIADEAVKRYDILSRFPNALEYNKIYGSTDNRIELKHGCSDKDILVLKVRVTSAYRKFFYTKIGTDSFLIKKDWIGQFSEVSDIHVFEVNKHDYNI